MLNSTNPSVRTGRPRVRRDGDRLGDALMRLSVIVEVNAGIGTSRRRCSSRRSAGARPSAGPSSQRPAIPSATSVPQRRVEFRRSAPALRLGFQNRLSVMTVVGPEPGCPLTRTPFDIMRGLVRKSTRYGIPAAEAADHDVRRA